jgi:hypothetical protein
MLIKSNKKDKYFSQSHSLNSCLNVYSRDKLCCSGLFQSKLILSIIFGFLQPIQFSIFITPNRNAKYLLQSESLNSHVNAPFPKQAVLLRSFPEKIYLNFQLLPLPLPMFYIYYQNSMFILPNRNGKYLLQSESLNSRVNVHFPKQAVLLRSFPE